MKKDPLYVNKVAGGILVAVLVLLLIGYAGAGLYHVEKDANAYPIEVSETADSQTGKATAIEVVLPEISPLLADADIESGASISKKCISCHGFNENGKNKVGPNLWNIVGADIAANTDFSYSDVLRDMDGVWDYEALNQFIANPKKFAKGTKMSFSGIRKEQQRANLIAYLRAQSATPLPLP